MNGSQYSTSSEINTGEKWIDGKTIYRKTYKTTKTIASMQTIEIPITVTCSSIWIDVQNSFIKTTNNSVIYNLPVVSYNCVNGEDICAWVNSSAIRLGSAKGSWNENWEKIVTIRYTK